mgnify:FL=1
MKHILEYEDFLAEIYLLNFKNSITESEYNDIYEFGDIILECGFTKEEILIFLKEECGYEEEDALLFFFVNEGLWDKLKAGASAIKAGATTLKDKAVELKDKTAGIRGKVSDVYHKTRDVGSRVKDHLIRHKGKYILGAGALLGGAGLPAAALALGAGHYMDKHDN